MIKLWWHFIMLHCTANYLHFGNETSRRSIMGQNSFWSRISIKIEIILIHGAVCKLGRHIFASFWPRSTLSKQVYYLNRVYVFTKESILLTNYHKVASRSNKVFGPCVLFYCNVVLMINYQGTIYNLLVIIYLPPTSYYELYNLTKNYSWLWFRLH